MITPHPAEPVSGATGSPVTTRRDGVRLRASRRGDAVLGAGAAAILGAAVWLDGDAAGVHIGGIALPGTCAWRLATGVDCPFCGMTRSFVALADGDVALAFACHPAGPVAAAGVLAALAGVVLVALRRGFPLHARDGFRRALLWATVACAAAGAGRAALQLVARLGG